MKKLAAQLVFFLCSLPALAGMTPLNYEFQAPVTAFDGKSVTVLHRGKLWKVPRPLIRAPQSLKTGQFVGVSLGAKDFKKVKIKSPPPFKR